MMYYYLLVVFNSTEQPGAPADLELTDPGARSVQLTWTPGDEHNSPIKSTTRTHTPVCMLLKIFTFLLGVRILSE